MEPGRPGHRAIGCALGLALVPLAVGVRGAARGQETSPQEGAPPPPAAAPALDEKQIAWMPSYPEAVRRARDEKKPLLVAFNMDGEIACDALAETTYRDKKLVEKSRSFLCVICCTGKHEETVGADGVAQCRRFGRVGCADHRQCEVKASDALIGSDVVIAPQHVIVAPDGRVIARRAWQLSVQELTRMMDAALRLIGAPGAPPPPDPKAERARIEELLHQAEKASYWRKDEYVKQIVDLETEQSRAMLLAYLARRDANDDTRVAIVTALGRKGDYTVLDVLRKATRDGKAYVALAAVDALGKIGLPEAKEDLKKLLGAFQAGNDYGRVLRAYAACGPDDAGVRDLVLKRAKGSDQNVRAHAIAALASLKSSPEIDEFLKKALDDDITVPRACAAWAVGMGRHHNCRKQLEKLAVTESVQDLKDIALTALAHLDHDPADAECCSLESKISNFVTLGDTRR
jgi:hypothetical protein